MRIEGMSNVASIVQQKVDTDKKASKPEPKKVDKVEINSSGAVKSDDVVKVSAKVRIDNTPDIREAKVQEVEAKIANGYYDSEEFIENLAQKLMDDNLLP